MMFLYMKKIRNIHPGEILKEEFLIPLQITQYVLANETGLSHATISNIIHGKSHITPDIALRLSKFLGTSSEFWLGLQNSYNIYELKTCNKQQYAAIKSYKLITKRLPGRPNKITMGIL